MSSGALRTSSEDRPRLSAPPTIKTRTNLRPLQADSGILRVRIHTQKVRLISRLLELVHIWLYLANVKTLR